MPKSPPKTKEERVKETMNILKKLIELGVSKTDSSFIELKQRMSEWVETGYPWNGKIKFRSYRRLAIINLPETNRAAATVEFNVSE